MFAIQLHDTKDFIKKLLIQPTFDHFCFIEGTITTFNTFILDGKLQKDFFSEDELDETDLHELDYSLWETIRPYCFEIIKGKNTPLSFRITLALSPTNMRKTLEHTGLLPRAAEVKNLLCNIRFSNGKITITSAVSLNSFSLDKIFEQEWDLLLAKFLKQNQIFGDEI